MCDNKGYFRGLGVYPGDLGSQKSHKGYSTLVVYGNIMLSLISETCLMEIWIMDQVMDRYFHYNKAGSHCFIKLYVWFIF